MAGAGRDLKTLDAYVDQALAKLREQLQRLLNLPWIGGELLTEQTVTTAATRISHGLQRVPRGWWVVRVRSGPGALSEGGEEPDESFLIVVASADTVVDLWVW